MPIPAEVTTEDDRVLGLKEIDPGEMMDLIEAAGSAMASQSSSAWLSYASIVCTVRSINGIPEPWPTTKSDVKALANRIGNSGLVAVQKAIADAEAPTEGAAVGTAKN